ncbi:MAG: hypothetical protein U0V56_02805 [Actinomycetota bacterium]
MGARDRADRPFLAIWTSARIARERERRSIRAALRDDGDAVFAYLAHVAVTHRPCRAPGVSRDPMGDLEGQRHRGLATLQLERLRRIGTP